MSFTSAAVVVVAWHFGLLFLAAVAEMVTRRLVALGVDFVLIVAQAFSAWGHSIRVLMVLLGQALLELRDLQRATFVLCPIVFDELAQPDV